MIDIVSHHLPDREGTAAGRMLDAVVSGLRAASHDVRVISWTFPHRPFQDGDAPCDVVVVPTVSAPRKRARALLWPRTEVVRAGIQLRPGAVAIADDPESWPVVALATDSPVRALTVHYSSALDAAATGRTGLALQQDLRAERRSVAQADCSVALSDRVMAAVGTQTHAPAALHMPTHVAPLPDAPVAGILADWGWAPNRLALGHVLAVWPDVRNRIPSARLLLAGRGDPAVGTLPGVEVRGTVARAEDFLADVATVVFPCPNTSGPKIKSLEALAHGRALLTSTAGLEGLRLPDGAAVVTNDRSLADELAGLLGAPEDAATIGHRGREAVRRWHAPEPAASARLSAALAASRGVRERGTDPTPEP